jgi:hypothetical protein
MRAILVLGVAAGLIGLAPEPATAVEGPWCMRASAGKGHAVEICHFATFQACNHERALWGTTGHCVQNHRYLPYWYGRGIDPPPRAALRKKKPRRH